MSEHKNLTRSMLKEVVLEQKEELQTIPRGIERNILPKMIEFFDSKQILIVQGVRRAGKSTLLFQLMDALALKDIHYLNFEDERLVSFQVDSFNLLLEIFYEVNGKQQVFFFDEIQIVPHWELFIRRLHNSGNKIIITGSNATLLSQELGTKLTGRHIDLELSPFSFSEFLSYHQYTFQPNDLSITKKRGLLNKYFHDYLHSGGLPIYLDSPFLETLSGIYEDIIIRDVLQRYKIDNQRTFREIALFLTSNATSSITYTKLAAHFKLGSTNTMIKYLNYLENSYYLYIINPFSASFKKQINAPKKIYIVSNAFISKIGFYVSNKEGALLENLVYLELRKRFNQIFYYKTNNELEVDFLVYNDLNKAELIQVAWSLAEPKTRRREISALIKAAEETSIQTCKILTLSETETIVENDITIEIIPAYQWLLIYP